jgi:hypothetical protein
MAVTLAAFVSSDFGGGGQKKASIFRVRHLVVRADKVIE